MMSNFPMFVYSEAKRAKREKNISCEWEENATNGVEKANVSEC